MRPAQAAGALPGNPDPRYPGVVRMRGLPFSAGAEQVLQFFQGCGGDVVPEGILLTYTHDGRATGEAYVEFVRMDDAVDGHIRATSNTDASPQDVLQAFMHVAVYAGVPKANHAIKLAKQTYSEMGVTL